jgi:poly(hydroxyalkanoate) granule-associated protein
MVTTSVKTKVNKAAAAPASTVNGAAPPAPAAAKPKAAAKASPKPRAKAAPKGAPSEAAPSADKPAPAAEEAANSVRLSAQQVWQAGLAAFAKAQEEGGRVFSKLVQEGHKLAEEKTFGVAGSTSELAAEVGKQASGSWDKLEHVFEERVARALAKLGVPAQKELDALTLRVDALSRELAALKAGAKAAPAPAKAVSKAAPKTVTKTARAPAAVKKAASK